MGLLAGAPSSSARMLRPPVSETGRRRSVFPVRLVRRWARAAAAYGASHRRPERRPTLDPPKSNGFKPFGSLRIPDARRRGDRRLGAIARISRRERLADTCAAQSDGPLIRLAGGLERAKTSGRQLGRFRAYRASPICQIPTGVKRRSPCPPARPALFVPSRECGAAEAKVGSLIEFKFGNLTTLRFRVAKLEPGRHVAWAGVDVPDEWEETPITFDIAPDGDSANLKVSQTGSAPDYMRRSRDSVTAGASTFAASNFCLNLERTNHLGR